MRYNKLMQTTISTQGKVVFYSTFFVTIGLFLYLIRNYSTALFISFLVVLLFHPVYLRIHAYVPKYPFVASILTFVVALATVIIPLGLLLSLAVSQGIYLMQSLLTSYSSPEVVDQWSRTLNSFLPVIASQGVSITPESLRSTISSIAQNGFSTLSQFAGILTGATVSAITGIIVFITVFFTTLSLKQDISKHVVSLIPLPTHITQLYLSRSLRMIRDMLKATGIVALLQAGLATLLFVVLGVPYVAFLAVLILLSSFIPYVGSALVIIPTALFYLAIGDYLRAGIIFASLVVLGSVDNVLRPFLTSSDTKVHPALILLCILGATSQFGLFGIIYGPVLAILLKTSVEVYEKEFRK